MRLYPALDNLTGEWNANYSVHVYTDVKRVGKGLCVSISVYLEYPSVRMLVHVPACMYHLINHQYVYTHVHATIVSN